MVYSRVKFSFTFIGMRVLVAVYTRILYIVCSKNTLTIIGEIYTKM